MDLPFISPVVLETGGDIYYTKNFNDRLHYEKLMYDVFRVCTRNYGNDVSFRLRTSEGYRVTKYYGTFIRKERIDFDLPSIDADRTIGVELQPEGKLPGNGTFSI